MDVALQALPAGVIRKMVPIQFLCGSQSLDCREVWKLKFEASGFKTLEYLTFKELHATYVGIQGRHCDGVEVSRIIPRRVSLNGEWRNSLDRSPSR